QPSNAHGFNENEDSGPDMNDKYRRRFKELLAISQSNQRNSECRRRDRDDDGDPRDAVTHHLKGLPEELRPLHIGFDQIGKEQAGEHYRNEVKHLRYSNGSGENAEIAGAGVFL